jgi:hypothetical protein
MKRLVSKIIFLFGLPSDGKMKDNYRMLTISKNEFLAIASEVFPCLRDMAI